MKLEVEVAGNEPILCSWLNTKMREQNISET